MFLINPLLQIKQQKQQQKTATNTYVLPTNTWVHKEKYMALYGWPLFPNQP